MAQQERELEDKSHEIDGLRRVEEKKDDHRINVLIIDDEHRTVSQFQSFFDRDGWRATGPDFDLSIDDDRFSQRYRVMMAFFESFSDEQMQELHLIIVDQFFDEPALISKCAAFLSRLKVINPACIIVETGSAISRKLYATSSACIGKEAITRLYYEWFDLEKLKPSARLFALRHFMSPYKLIASQTQVSEDAPRNRSELEQIVSRGITQLRESIVFSRLCLKYLGRTVETFLNEISHLTIEQQANFVHYCASILYVISIGGHSNDYGMPLQRLKGKLGIEDADTDNPTSG